MRMVLDIVVYGAVQSGIYILLSLGFSLTFGVAGIFNLAHGTFYMGAAYLLYSFVNVLGFGLGAALIVSVVGMGLLALFIQKWFVNPVAHSGISVMIITVAIANFLEQVVLSTYGPVDRNIDSFIDKRLMLFNMVSIDAQRMLALGASVVLLVGLYVFISKTKPGKAILAVSQDREGAIFVGIDPQKVFYLVMFIAAVLAGIAGAFIAPTIGARPSMWLKPLTICFSVVILGGLGSLTGTVLAALIIGYSEVIVSFVFSSYMSELVPFVIILIALAFRPSGLVPVRDSQS